MPTASAAHGLGGLRVGFVGTGTMSSAIVRGLCTLPEPPASVVVSPRNAQKAAALVAELPGRVSVGADNQAVVAASDLVFVGVLPAQTEAVVRALSLTRGRHQVISLVSTARLGDLREWCAPLEADAVAKAIPLPPVAEHAGATLLAPPMPIGDALFSALGSCVAVETEETLTSMLPVTCLMGTVYATQRATQDWLVGRGVPAPKAAAYVGAIFRTVTHDSAHADESTFDRLVNEQTPGGLNEQVVREMKEAGFFDVLTDSLDGALARVEGRPRPEGKRRRMTEP